MIRPFRSSVILALAGTALALAACGGDERVASGESGDTPPAEATSLWVVTAGAGTTSGPDESLIVTLTDVDDHVTQFTDRPMRAADTRATEEFAQRWAEWFGDIAPNAALTFLTTDAATPQAIVLEVDAPSYDPAVGTLTFTAERIPSRATTEPAVPTPTEFASASLLLDDGNQLQWPDPENF